MQTSDTPLKFLGPQWFALIMGWGGLSLAWMRGAQVLAPSVAAPVALAAGIFAFAIYGAVFVLSLVRVLRYPEALNEDLAHPVRHAFAGAFPVSTVLLSAVSSSVLELDVLARVLFVFGIVLQTTVTVWVVSGWFRNGLRWPAMTPIVLIPVVGNVLVPLAGVPLGFTNLSIIFLALGLLMWPIVLALLFARTAIAPLPERLLPSWFIMIAPSAISGPALVALGAPSVLTIAMTGVSAFFVLCALTLIPKLRRIEFGMPFWAMSFPSAAFSSIMSATVVLIPGLFLVAVFILLAVTTLILWLSLQTVRGLLGGRLLVPEPVQQSVVAKG